MLHYGLFFLFKLVVRHLSISIICPKIGPCSFSSSKRNALKLIDLERNMNRKIAPHIFFVSDSRWVQRLKTLLSHNEAVSQSGVDINSIPTNYTYKFMKNDLFTSSFHELPIPNSEFSGFVYPLVLLKRTTDEKNSFRIFSIK